MTICRVEDCGRKMKGHGYCSLHLQRLQRTGTVEKLPLKKKPPRPCIVVGCAKISRYLAGYCDSHKSRMARHGSLEALKPWRRWTTTQLAALYSCCSTESLERLVALTGHPLHSIRNKAIKLGLNIRQGTFTVSAAMRTTGYSYTQIKRAMAATQIRRRHSGAKRSHWKLTEEDVSTLVRYLGEETRHGLEGGRFRPIVSGYVPDGARDGGLV